MYWDVIEVKPEPGYRLFVRFKDGVTGRVQLHPEELTGALAPLLDTGFFEKVFVDEGAVAWPGEIDLAPDAMYAQVTGYRNGSEGDRTNTQGCDFQSRLPRIYELKGLLDDPSNPDAYFQNLEMELRNPICLKSFELWEKQLRGLDFDAWNWLKPKASRYLKNRDPRGRGWQQIFDALAEAPAYNYLRKSVGCKDVRFISEASASTPDLEGTLDGAQLLCEVKTINISDDEVRARLQPTVVRDVSNQLTDGFLSKLDSDIRAAKTQLQSYDPEHAAQWLVYINVCFDDWVGIYKSDYIEQIKQHLSKNPPGTKVVANAGFAETDTHVVAQE